ncbi:MAG: BatA domain-containing protein, partial [Thermoplasmata archaeon]
MKKIPSGISDLDSILHGGLPAGSIVLLFTEIGAGGIEYTYTASAKLLKVKETPEDLRIILGDNCKEAILPEKIFYISFSRSKEDILEEVKMSFNQDYYDVIETGLNFKDLSEAYFKRTMVPSSWTGSSGPSIFSNNGGADLLTELVDFLDTNARDNVVIIDSLTDLLTNSNIMAFVNLSLLLGTLLVGVPIVLHLVMRQKPTPLEFPAIRFLRQRRESNQRRLRLRHWLLLLLRCLVLALAALALARTSLSSNLL